MKGMGEKIAENENDRVVKRMYVGMCAGGWTRKRWIDTVKVCLKKKKVTQENGI